MESGNTDGTLESHMVLDSGTSTSILVPRLRFVLGSVREQDVLFSPNAVPFAGIQLNCGGRGSLSSASALAKLKPCFGVLSASFFYQKQPRA